MKKYKAYFYILLAAASWGCIGLFSRRLLAGGVSPENIVVIRNFGSLVMLTIIFLAVDKKVFHVKPKHLPIFFGTGVVSVLLFTLCYFHAQELCSLAVAAILLYTAPAMVVVMSAMLWKEPVTKRKLLALGLALVGCACVTGVFSGGLSLTPVGFLYGIGSAFFYALYSIFGRCALRHYAPMTVVYWTFVFAGIGALCFMDAPALLAALSDVSTALSALGIVAVSTVLPYILYTRGLAEVESGKASIMASLEPVVASFVGILIYSEPMSAGVFLGLGCILACVYVLR